jgi:hypothetical protein
VLVLPFCAARWQPARTAVKLVIKLSMESNNLSDVVGLVFQDFIFHA